MTEKKLLVVQVRDNPNIAEHDAGSYSRIIGDSISCDIKNVTSDSLHIDHIEDYDAYIVGGSHYMTHDDFPQKEELYQLIRYAIDTKKPLLGVCFGFQVLAEAAGGTVLHDPTRKEFGSYDITLTPDGQDDPLFKDISKIFVAQEAHESYAPELPPNCIHLGHSENIAIQAFRYGNNKIYGVQFHPELSLENMHERMKMYNSGPVTTFFFHDEVFESIRESRDSEKVITNFIDLVCADA